jgi:hypothetical protein
MLSTIFKLLGSFLISLALLPIIAAIAEIYEWRFFTGWGLGHGTVLIVFPVLMFVSYLFIDICSRWLGKKK